MPPEFLDLGADSLAQHVEPGGSLFRLDPGRRELAILSNHRITRFIFAGALPLKLGQRQTHFLDRLRKVQLGFLIVAQCRFDAR